MKKPIYYALYKGDKYLYGGTKEELAKYLNVKPRTIDFYSRPSYLKRVANAKEPYIVIRVKEEDDDWES